MQILNFRFNILGYTLCIFHLKCWIISIVGYIMYICFTLDVGSLLSLKNHHSHECFGFTCPSNLIQILSINKCHKYVAQLETAEIRDCIAVHILLS